MRVRTALAVLVAVNVLWAAAFIGYLRRSTTPVIKPLTESPVVTTKPAAPVPPATAATAAAPTNQIAVVVNTNPAPHVFRSLPSADKKFGWRDVTNDTYLDYVASLRAIGCPDKQVHNLVVADVNDLFDQRRLDHAVKTDAQWWKAETFMGILPMQNFAGVNFDDERRSLLAKLLGPDQAEAVKLPSLNPQTINLTGPVLGALPAESWNNVQEICSRSIDRHQTYQMARINENGLMDNTELARLRDQTRADLKKVLTPEQMEDFLLRFSFNSSKLRQDTRGLDLTPGEFRKIFRAIDPLEHQMQVDYGGAEALSPKQRQELESQRERAMKETLSPERYAQYLATKDPLYQQALAMATQSGLSTKAVQPLYEMQKSLDARRVQIMQNVTMTPPQRDQALQAISLEHQQTLQRILSDTAYRR